MAGIEGRNVASLLVYVGWGIGLRFWGVLVLDDVVPYAFHRFRFEG